MSVAKESTGLMIIKVWFEPGGLRARLTSTFDLEEGETVITAVSSAAAVQATVSEWLTRWATYHNEPGAGG